MQVFIIFVALAVILGILGLYLWGNHKETKRQIEKINQHSRDRKSEFLARQEKLEFEEMASRKKGGYYYPNKPYSVGSQSADHGYVPMIPVGVDTLLVDRSRVVDEIGQTELPSFLGSIPDPAPGSDSNPYPIESHRYEPPATVEPARSSADDDLTRNSSWLGGWGSVDTSSSHSSTSSYLSSDTFTTSADSCSTSDTSSSSSWSSND